MQRGERGDERDERGRDDTSDDDGSIDLNYEKVVDRDRSIKMTWDIVTSELVMEVSMPVNQWFAIGFGEEMYGTDMIVWHAATADSGVEPYAGDYFAAWTSPVP